MPHPSEDESSLDPAFLGIDIIYVPFFKKKGHDPALLKAGKARSPDELRMRRPAAFALRKTRASPREYEIYVCYYSKNHIKLLQENSDSLWVCLQKLLHVKIGAISWLGVQQGSTLAQSAALGLSKYGHRYLSHINRKINKLCFILAWWLFSSLLVLAPAVEPITPPPPPSKSGKPSASPSESVR
jgi:hypothetical protein